MGASGQIPLVACRELQAAAPPEQLNQEGILACRSFNDDIILDIDDKTLLNLLPRARYGRLTKDDRRLLLKLAPPAAYRTQLAFSTRGRE